MIKSVWFLSLQCFLLFQQRLLQTFRRHGSRTLFEPHIDKFLLSFHEENWLRNCLAGCKPFSNRKYIDDTFILFRDSSQTLDFFLNIWAFKILTYHSIMKSDSTISYCVLTKLLRKNIVFLAPLFFEKTSSLYLLPTTLVITTFSLRSTPF